MRTQEKLTTGSAVFLSLTSMLGAGIFIRVRTINALAHGATAPVVILFLLFFLGMVAFCHVLTRIVPHQTGNMGFMEWSRRFCGRTLHRDFCSFVRNLYYPVSLLLFSVYGVLGVTGERLGVCATLLLALFFVILLLAINFISFKWSRRLQMALLAVVAVPMLLLPIMGMVAPGGDYSAESKSAGGLWGGSGGPRAEGIGSWGPWMILFSGLPSLLFIYDGFYGVAALNSRLKNPRSLTYVILWSMGLVTLAYLNVMVGFGAGDPRGADFRRFRLLAGREILIDSFELMMGCAGFMTLNSIIMGCMPQLRAMHRDARFWDVDAIRRYIFYREIREDEDFEERFCVLLSVVWRTLAVFLLTGIAMGIVVYCELGGEPKGLLDAMADMVTVFVFVILLATVWGSYRRNGVARESQLFRVCCRICGAIIVGALAYMVLSYAVGIGGYAGASPFDCAAKLMTMATFGLITFWPRIYRGIGRLRGAAGGRCPGGGIIGFE